jgi:nitrite reductase/ring-hydroxylating ferredoxin subunit
MGLVAIGAVSEVPVGRSKAYEVGGRTIALYHTADGFFATDNVCPHRGGPLAKGDLIGNEINCPWHLWGFDVVTGRCTGNASVSVVSYPVVVENERVFVRIE